MEGRKICGAKTRKGGKCQRSPMKNGRCRTHGGASLPAGPSHPRYKTGRFSKVNTQIVERLTSYLADDDLADQRQSLAVFDMRLDELLNELAANGSPLLWLQLENLRLKVVLELKAGNETAANALIAEILATIERGASDAEKWEAIYKNLELRDKVAKTQQKKEQDESMSIPVIVYHQMLQKIAEAIEDIIDDPELRFRLIERIKTNVNASEPAPIRRALPRRKGASQSGQERSTV